MRLRLLLLIAAAALVPSAAASPTDFVPAASFPASGELLWATVTVRAQPDSKARAIVAVREFRSDFRPQYLLALDAAVDDRGDIWYRVSIARRPNGTVGWIPAASLDARPTDRRIVVHRGSRTLEVRDGGRVIFRTQVAVGKPGAETPLGRNFFITAEFRPTDPFLGVWALETSAYSRLSEWPGGGIVGIHGTSLPQLIGQAVSHGCIRVRNAAAERLKALVPVGTPLDIVAD